jgi:hypothetical protein
MFQIFGECCAVAAASGFKPRPAFIEFDTTLITTVGSPLKWSMLRDIERGLNHRGRAHPRRHGSPRPRRRDADPQPGAHARRCL